LSISQGKPIALDKVRWEMKPHEVTHFFSETQ